MFELFGVAHFAVVHRSCWRQHTGRRACASVGACRSLSRRSSAASPDCTVFIAESACSGVRNYTSCVQTLLSLPLLLSFPPLTLLSPPSLSSLSSPSFHPLPYSFHPSTAHLHLSHPPSAQEKAEERVRARGEEEEGRGGGEKGEGGGRGTFRHF